jgi:hypothetical protein
LVGLLRSQHRQRFTATGSASAAPFYGVIERAMGSANDLSSIGIEKMSRRPIEF